MPFEGGGQRRAAVSDSSGSGGRSASPPPLVQERRASSHRTDLAVPLLLVISQPTMEAVVGRVSQVHFSLAAGRFNKKSWNGGRSVERCGYYGVQRRTNMNSSLLRCKREVMVRAVSESSDGEEGAPEAASGLLAWYMDQTNRHPVSTKAITSAILNLLGDVFCQLVVDKSKKFDIKRTAVITFLGFILVGPTLHTWYLALSKVVTATGVSGAAIRLVLDQFIFSPAFVALFFASLLTLELRPKDIVPKLKQDWKPTVIANWKLWIPFQFINFLFVPQQLQVAFANVVALAWNVYLSFASHKAVAVAIPSATVDIEMSPFDGEK